MFYNREDDEIPKQCPYCGSKEIIVYDGYIVCGNCGFIIDEVRITPEREWRIFNSTDISRKSRTSKLTMLEAPEDMSRTAIKEDNGKYSTVPISSPIEKSFVRIKYILEEFANKLKLTAVTRVTAIRLLSLYIHKKNIREKEKNAMVAAALYAASRMTNNPKPLDKIIRVTKVRKKAVSKAFKMLKEIVGVSIKPPDPEKYIISFGKELGLSGKCIKLALFISQSAKERGLGIGKDPAGLAAAALYFASLELGEKRTQKRIAEVAAITEVTVRNRYRELRKKLNDIFSQPHLLSKALL
ncbi:MAG: TFIIB-type zinc ribbon-containing protein [Candidatus Njordarchaeia archaeon]